METEGQEGLWPPALAPRSASVTTVTIVVWDKNIVKTYLVHYFFPAGGVVVRGRLKNLASDDWARGL